MLIRSMLAGAVATSAMTDTMTRLAPHLRLAEVDVPAMLGSVVNDNRCPRRNSAAWATGMAIHYFLGAVAFPVAYETVFKRLLPGNRMLKSLEWGVGLWAVGQFAVMPALKKYGYFKEVPDAKLTYLIAHLIYGATFCAGEGGKSDVTELR